MQPHTIILLPGYTNSGPEHWQSLWEKEHPNFLRVQQKDWDNPECTLWVDTLEATLQTVKSPVILVGHSCGSLMIIHWANRYHNQLVKGALIVAPADPDSNSFPSAAIGFSPLPQNALPFKSIVVCSSNDLYLSVTKASHYAKAWGSELVNIGDHGHINTAAGLGDWPQGKNLLNQLKKR